MSRVCDRTASGKWLTNALEVALGQAYFSGIARKDWGARGQPRVADYTAGDENSPNSAFIKKKWNFSKLRSDYFCNMPLLEEKGM